VDGVLAVWSEEPDRPFESRIAAAGFDVKRHRAGKGGRAHTIYTGVRRASTDRAPRPARRGRR
jgi:hypothetical protein